MAPPRYYLGPTQARGNPLQRARLPRKSVDCDIYVVRYLAAFLDKTRKPLKLDQARAGRTPGFGMRM